MMYDHEKIRERREAGWEWADIAVADYPGKTAKQLRQAHNLWEKRQEATEPPPPEPNEPRFQAEVTVSTEELKRLTSLADVIQFYDVDTEKWEVVRMWVQGNSWDQSPTFTCHQFKIKAEFALRTEEQAAQLETVWEQFKADAEAHTPAYTLPERRPPAADDPCLALLAINDPHFGMLAWGKETGEDYDLNIAVRDYRAAVEHLLGVTRIYPVERIAYLLGNDMEHVNQAGEGGKGGATKRGTAQDLDTRIAKIFTAIRRAAVKGLDMARLIAPTDGIIVPGNHDPDEMYKLGEVLSAWYRNDPDVDIQYGPAKRRFYGYGKNAFMLTHGEEYKRKRDNLPLIFATESPTDIWVASDGGCREVLTGHNHISMQGGYYPTAEVDETRAIRTRSLPGLTATDAWHYEEGYKHRRAATLLVYRRSGGIVGLHEFNL